MTAISRQQRATLECTEHGNGMVRTNSYGLALQILRELRILGHDAFDNHVDDTTVYLIYMPPAEIIARAIDQACRTVPG